MLFGSILIGFVVYQGGGFINFNGNGWGWVVCFLRVLGFVGFEWILYGRNLINVESFNYCIFINFKVIFYFGQGVVVWQYIQRVVICEIREVRIVQERSFIRKEYYVWGEIMNLVLF